MHPGPGAFATERQSLDGSSAKSAGGRDPRIPVILVRSPLVGADLEVSLLSRGAAVELREPEDLGVDALRSARRRGTRAVVTVNHSAEVALLCATAGIAYVSWTIDPLSRKRWAILGGTDLRATRLFVHRRALLEPLRAMGYPAVEWMPLACAPRRWSDPVEPREGKGSPLFVGSSLQDERGILVKGLERWGIGGALAAVDAMLSGLSRACLWDRSFPGFLRAPETLPPSLLSIAGPVDPLEVAEVLDAGLTWHFRREMVALLAERGVEIKGDDGWREVAGERWTGPLLNGRDMTSAYAGSALNLDAPRFHQREIATLRAFDVLGSGGPFACETGTEMDDLFAPGEQFLSWSCLAELESVLEAARRGDPAFGRIAAAGRRAVREHHSMDARAARILDAVRATDPAEGDS